MFEREYETFARRHQELSDRLADPAIFQNPNEYRDVNREFSRISKVYEALKAYKTAEQRLADAKEMLRTEKDAELLELAQLEFDELKDSIEELRQGVVEAMVPPDADDEKNAILEIRAGTGGDEAALFAGDLFRMYSRYVEQQRWKMTILELNPGDAGGYKEVIALIEGDQIFKKLRNEGGIHRVQRVPATESSGRIHTSAVTVAVLPEVEEVDFEIAEKDIRVDVFRSGGPGGQSVNTTDSAVRITHLPTGEVVSCQDEKSQIKNKARALMVLRARLNDRFKAEQEAVRAAERKSMVGTGDRSGKCRTYNFPQNRVTDHRIGLTKNNLSQVLEGEIDEFVEALGLWHRRLQVEAALEQVGEQS